MTRLCWIQPCLMDLDSILSFDKKHEDFYHLLGCDELSSVEQIMAEFKHKARIFHPDKNPVDPNASKMFANLQRGKEVLTDPKLRLKYDFWRRSGLMVPFDMWLDRQLSSSLHWASEGKKELMIKDTQSSSLDLETETTANASDNKQWTKMPACSSSVLSKFRNYQI
ncbi:dnaJ homolog subfamily C member 12-like isoform X2 [Corticium candelabrum]|uniref:dnaJ homolog subfamily C member 12-like isoform X2 n=1 Tax=Corticium candelabrum TaxID=121492 RepID=UPI002E252F4F|nr:dnaJ homolog subfamily C member 12-like isoform X2 [Corticium candelabrum]